MYKKLSIIISSTILSSTIITGCASKPESLKTTVVNTKEYQSLNCNQISKESKRVKSKIKYLYKVLDDKASNDQLQLASSLLLWPMVFTLEGGDGQEAQEYSRLKGEIEALEKTSIQKNCNIEFSSYRLESIIKEIEKDKELEKKKIKNI
jgi:outer membrane murein-binding lipoprotein Lpp